jgi:amino acid transporter
MSRPEKDIPFALIGATLFIALFYILIQVVTVGTYPDLANSIKPIADAAHFFMGSAGGIMITVGAVLSIGGTLNTNLLAGSRLPYAFSEEGQYPKIFLKTSAKTAIPYVSLIIYTVVTIIVSLTGTFIYALSINVITKALLFAIISAALIKFRRVDGSPKQGFRLRFGYFYGVAGIIICAWLLYVSDLSDFIDVVLTTLAGILLYFLFKIKIKK